MAAMSAAKLFSTILALIAYLSTASAQNACAAATGTTTTYVINPTSCAAWIACNNGAVVNTGTCASGYLFNSATSSCAIASTVTCPTSAIMNICVGLNNTAVANPDNCKGYYYCINGIGSAGLCNTGYAFNTTTKVCDYLPNYVCPATSTSGSTATANASCTNVPDGTFLANSASCSAYYVCVNGQPVAGTCNATIPLYFDVSTGACDYPSNVACDISGDGTSTAISAGYNYTAICDTTNTTAHFANDPGNCTGYFYCNAANDTAPSHGYCPNQLYFDMSTQECASPSTVNCTLQPCVDKPVGYFDIDSTSCAGFYYCSATGAVEGNCTTGYYFDVANQDCNTPAAVNCTIA